MSYYAKIDCAITRDPRMISVGPLGRLIYMQSVLYCRENLTDGVIDRLLLPLVAVDIPNPIKHMNNLVEVGALEAIEQGWRIPEPVWRKYNPLRAEVDEIRKAESDRKASWRDRKKRDANVPTGHNGVSHRDKIVALGQRDAQRETERETETERESLPSPKRGFA